MHTKVFVGNLSFKTKAEELAAEFSVAGRVVSANIITRGPRSLGYGFVEMESEEEAQKAVTLLNKKSVDGREINVELAKPREDKPPQERGERRPPNRGRRGGRGGRGGGPRGPPRGSGDNNSNNNAQNNRDVNVNAQNNAPQTNQAGGSPQGSRRPFRSRPRFNRGGGRGGLESNNNQDGAPRRPRSRFNRGQRDFANRTPSPTTLFVANLPFALDNEGLLKLFKDLKVSKAHVVNNRNGRSKGFGFVEFENEADQKAALAASEKMAVDGRELIVKVALTAPEIHRDAAPTSAPSQGTSAAASPATTPAATTKDSQAASKTDEKSS